MKLACRVFGHREVLMSTGYRVGQAWYRCGRNCGWTALRKGVRAHGPR